MTDNFGPNDDHAFENLPVLHRPKFGDHQCPICHGHGAWNNQFFAHGRVIIQECDTCNGRGWLGAHDERLRHDIVMKNGHPAWVLVIEK